MKTQHQPLARFHYFPLWPTTPTSSDGALLLVKMVFFILLAIVPGSAPSNAGEVVVTEQRVQSPAQSDAASYQASRWLPRLPLWQSIQFSIPDKIKVNEPFRLSARFKAELFDIPDLALALEVVGNNLKWVSGQREWKGGLKKGEVKVMDCVIVATTNGISGRCSLEMSSHSVLPSLRQYAESMDASTRDAFKNKQYTKEWVSKQERKNPVYRKTSDCIVHAGN